MGRLGRNTWNNNCSTVQYALIALQYSKVCISMHTRFVDEKKVFIEMHHNQYMIESHSIDWIL
jgi:hypothetical protein